ncbi:unnamed protein product [Callosobruchus maculatus]|uniref:Uncharacterized protein n=1 Tax=Callosobruchus maculatus TaxID=64391 RepID=A0A653D5U0_CALMS|nr:unnamed protein product [Callosobruchus maculatus]
MDGGSININSSMISSNTAGSSTGAVNQVLGPCRKRTNKSKPMRRNALDYLKKSGT